MENREINWKEVEVGTWFSAKKDGVKFEGKIQKDRGRIYLCQNEFDGADCNDKLGFAFSWSIDSGEESDMIYEGIGELTFLTKEPKNIKKSIKLTDEYFGVFNDGFLRVGCQQIPYDVILEVAKTIKKLKAVKKNDKD